MRSTKWQFSCAVLAIAPLLIAQSNPPARYPGFPSETPAKFQPSTNSFDYTRREEMIPMRDGVRLHTVILTPKGSKNAPILLTRTPYNAKELTGHAQSPHLGPVLQGYDNAVDVIVEGGYIRVVQDIRGKYGSEGDYVMNRPLSGTQNPTPVDHSTDTWDTIDWLVKNIPETNGKVGILGISYDGFLPLMALVNPHPALKVSVPMNPMVDGWMGDDWFHNGAFRQQNLPYIYEQQATKSNDEKWWSGHQDDYDLYMEAGSAGELAQRHGMEQIRFWRKILAHPAYDAFWREQAMDRILAAQPLKTPVMLVHSLWDQEDIYGALAVYKAIKPKDTANDKVPAPAALSPPRSTCRHKAAPGFRRPKRSKRHSMSTCPTPRSPCHSAAAPVSPSATITDLPGHSGLSTTSGKLRAARMWRCSCPRFCKTR